MAPTINPADVQATSRPTEPPLSVEAATAVLRAAEEAWHNRDLDSLLDALHPEVHIRFNNQPQVVGLDAARTWLQARFDNQLDYQLAKTLRGIDDTMIISSWTGQWRDAASGAHQRCSGIELLTLDNQLIRDWDAIMHTWTEDAS